MFMEPKKSELDVLLSNDNFKPVKTLDIPDGARVFGARFVDEIKRSDTTLCNKLHLVCPSYSDEGTKTIPTKAPTGQRLTTLSIEA